MKNNKGFDKWECKHCGNKFKTRRELNEHKRLNNHSLIKPDGTRIAWNKGLTAKTNESVARGVKTRAENIKSR